MKPTPSHKRQQSKVFVNTYGFDDDDTGRQKALGDMAGVFFSAQGALQVSNFEFEIQIRSIFRIRRELSIQCAAALRCRAVRRACAAAASFISHTTRSLTTTTPISLARARRRRRGDGGGGGRRRRRPRPGRAARARGRQQGGHADLGERSMAEALEKGGRVLLIHILPPACLVSREHPGAGQGAAARQPPRAAGFSATARQI